MTPRAKPDVTITLTRDEAEYFAQWCSDRKVEQEVNYRSMPPEAGSILAKLKAAGVGKRNTSTSRSGFAYTDYPGEAFLDVL